MTNVASDPSTLAPPTEAPAGKRARKRHETTARILAEAHALLREERFAGFSLRKLAARLDMRLSHIQHYYPQSTDLLAALFETFINTDTNEFLEAFQRQSGTAEQKLKRAVQALFEDEDYLAGCELFISEVSIVAKEDPRIAAAIELYYQRYYEAVAELLTHLAPDLTPAQKRATGLQIVALIEGSLRIRTPLRAHHKDKLARTLAEGILKLCQPAP